MLFRSGTTELTRLAGIARLAPTDLARGNINPPTLRGDPLIQMYRYIISRLRGVSKPENEMSILYLHSLTS